MWPTCGQQQQQHIVQQAEGCGGGMTSCTQIKGIAILGAVVALTRDGKRFP